MPSSNTAKAANTSGPSRDPATGKGTGKDPVAGTGKGPATGKRKGTAPGSGRRVAIVACAQSIYEYPKDSSREMMVFDVVRELLLKAGITRSEVDTVISAQNDFMAVSYTHLRAHET